MLWHIIHKAWCKFHTLDSNTQQNSTLWHNISTITFQAHIFRIFYCYNGHWIKVNKQKLKFYNFQFFCKNKIIPKQNLNDFFFFH